MATLLSNMNEAATLIQSKIEGIQPEIGLILGSGLGELADEIENAVQIDYSEIPHFPVSTVEGHAGKLVIGTLNGKTVLAMQGRFHYYEGYSMQDVTFPVRVMKGLGVKLLVVTNACGGMNPGFSAGDLMIINDHLNMTGANPLIGPNDAELGPRFPDMSTAYTPELVQFTKETAASLGINVQEGVYAGITGPTYMTKAELRMLRTVGGDAIGMSTVPEVIVASHMSLKVIGISCITDMAIADELEPLTHEQVVAVANRTKPKFINLVKEIVKNVTL
ncbi:MULTISPECIES: purine-nucleoside phosphorylase [Fictibacillus]|uniref:Purine nucleoside phosphorylase n=1 Tax=Fictibacillus enclensis TaxID=1017270 RepID=A0A0V8JEV3_9BACL|nr:MULTISPECIES: purine-nucleoside phosphorylase [Fictibacillus]KSU85647.1 purine nucleoside phosphorylase [Fictibacillus enclensis]RXY98659.1 purine-nucleoside phosphorylase [Fictibacillus sp. S7]SCC00276.1 purine-nucleoside phosphorylase [Fictibacillus enclensis]